MSIQRILQLRSAISISSRFFSTHVGGKPGGIIAAEPVKGAAFKIPEPIDDKCGPLGIDDEEEEDMVPMIDPDTGEWGGPTRGGTRPEPTRYGDWERNGRCTDF